jgi:mannosyltransferase OCH1-like enzyme
MRHTNVFNYYFYSDEQCDKFMKNIAPHINIDIYNAYCKLPLAVMKADLWRYCIIYHFGGIYADTDTICKTNPKLFIKDSLLTIVPENSCHLCQWVFAAPKGSPILKSVIDLSVERILSITEIKGEHIVHHLTGPGVFTDGIEKYLKEHNLPTFENKKLYYNYPHKDELTVFHCNIFHLKIVQHLFYGQRNNGWCSERDKHLL